MEEEEVRKAPTSLRDYLNGVKDLKMVLRWIFANVISPHSLRHMYTMLVYVVLMMAAQVVSPFLVSYVFNGLTKHSGASVVNGMVGFMVALLLHKYCQKRYDTAREWVIGLNWSRLDQTMDGLFFSKSLAQHAHHSSKLGTATIDKGKSRMLELQRILFFDAVPVILQLVLSLVCLVFLNWVAGIVMLTVVLAYFAWSLYLNTEVGRVCGPLDGRFRKLFRRRVDRMDKVERVVTTGQASRECRELLFTFDEIMRDDRSFWFRFINIAFARSVLNALGLIAIMSWGAWLVWKGELTLGLLYPLYSWAGRVSENIWRLGDIEHQINWNIPPVMSVIEAISIPPEIVDAPNAKVLNEGCAFRVEFNNVTHAYPEAATNGTNPPQAVRGVSFTIEPGEKVALLGPSGSGKTTLMKLLLRYTDPSSGDIKIDGTDLRNIATASWRKNVAYIPQQAQILDGTLRYNLTFALDDEERKKVTDGELWDLMRCLQIDFGERLTHGLDTLVGRNGIKLSGGQGQRLMIGAAVIRKCRFIVIDEATSSLDSTTERLVQSGLERLLEGSGTSALVVAHRLSTVRDMCGKFVVLKPADSVGEGESQVESVARSFVELYRTSPIFKKLADDQGLNIT